jgi:hypothetical protein
MLTLLQSGLLQSFDFITSCGETLVAPLKAVYFPSLVVLTLLQLTLALVLGLGVLGLLYGYCR